MNKIMNMDDFTQAINTYLNGDYDEDKLIQKFDDICADREMTAEYSLSDILTLIETSNLPEKLSKKLSSTISDPKTRLFIPPILEEEKEEKEENYTESSSLLNDLLKCNTNDENDQLQAGQIIRGTYQLISRIGEGGMGEVWKAIDLIQDAGDSKNKYVAIKFVSYEIRRHPYALKALVREFARYKQLIHPNIVKAYELNRDDNKIFIVMEYLEGLSLKDFIKQHPEGISLAEAKPIISSICKALSYAHKEGIIHLDLKPANIYYNPQTKKAKVIDFGIARLAEQSERDKTRFDPGTLGAVSTAYASVDMLLLDNSPDPRDDIYSLACVAYETLSGKHAFNGAIATKAERDKMHPKCVNGLKNAEFSAILNGLNFIRSERTSSTDQFFQDLYLPEITAKKKRTRWINISILLLILAIVTPILVNKSYNQWKYNQIIESISQNQQIGMDKFRALEVKKQHELLLNEKTLLVFTQFIIDHATIDNPPIKLINGFKKRISTQVYKNHDTRKKLIEYYINHINKSLNNNDFNKAIEYSINITKKFPDSKNLANQMDTVLNWKNTKLTQLEHNYKQCITDDSQSLINLYPCIQTTYELTSKLAPNHTLLSDTKLSDRYQKEISAALKKEELTQAEELIANWYHLNSTDLPQRKELINKLQHKKRVLETSQEIINNNDEQMEKYISSLLELDTPIKKEVLNQSKINKRLMTYYENKVITSIKSNDYTTAFLHIELASKVFNEVKQGKSNLKKLNKIAAKYKKNHLKELSKNYQETLSENEFDLNKLKSIQDQIANIDPNNHLIKLPGVSKVLAKKSNQAINKKQFKQAHKYLENWNTIKLSKNQRRKYLEISNKYEKKLSLHKKTINIKKQIIEAISNNQLASTNTLTEELNKNFSSQQSKEVINSVKKQLIIFYQKQIHSAIEKNAYKQARTISNTALQLLPKEKALIQQEKQINEAQKNHIKGLIKDFELALESDTADGKKIFSSLLSLQSIDDQYLESNPEPYHKLIKHLIALSKNELALEKLKDITTHWETFLTNKEKQVQANKIYMKAKNLIALYCLHTGRQLKEKQKLSSANNFLSFGLSLKPILSLEKALKTELEKATHITTSKQKNIT